MSNNKCYTEREFFRMLPAIYLSAFSVSGLGIFEDREAQNRF